MAEVHSGDARHRVVQFAVEGCAAPDAVVAEVGHDALCSSSGYYRALLRPDWCDDADGSASPAQRAAVRPEDLPYARQFAEFLLHGTISTDRLSNEQLLELCAYADRIAAPCFAREVMRRLVTPRNVLLVAPVPAFTPLCERYLLEHFEESFSFALAADNVAALTALLGNERDLLQRQGLHRTAKHSAVNSLVLSTLRSDELLADEEVVLQVVLEIYRACGMEMARPMLLSVRLKDVGLTQLDELRSSHDSALLSLLLPNLCDAYAYHSHIARRSLFVPFRSRQKLINTLSISSWDELSGGAALKLPSFRWHLVGFAVELSRNASGGLAASLHVQHTFAEEVPLAFTLCLSGAAGQRATKSFLHAFSECNIPHGWDDVGLQCAGATSLFPLSVRCYVQFVDTPLEESSFESDGHSGSNDE